MLFACLRLRKNIKGYGNNDLKHPKLEAWIPNPEPLHHPKNTNTHTHTLCKWYKALQTPNEAVIETLTGTFCFFIKKAHLSWSSIATSSILCWRRDVLWSPFGSSLACLSRSGFRAWCNHGDHKHSAIVLSRSFQHVRATSSEV